MPLPLRTLSNDEYLALRANATVLERDLHGDKVLRLEDGSYLKLFRRKRLISSAAWYPYAQRFADNALKLRQRDIPCPEVIDVYRIPDARRDAVHYRPLAGETLRRLVQSGAAGDDLRIALARFVAQLHARGVYFRSLHFGNIVLTPSGGFGLIDIADLRTRNKPIPDFYRQRNLLHLCRAPADREWLHAAGSTAFEKTYRSAQAAGTP